VIAVDTGAEKKKLCLSLGADCFIDFKESKDLIEEIKKVCGGIGPHVSPLLFLLFSILTLCSNS
jgi:propanol-preferring alcohol dehydrogenase